MLTLEKLKKTDAKLENEIWNSACKKELVTDKINPIYDGLYSPELYWNSPLRIMWILKEPYDDFDKKGNPKGGNWSITKDFFHDPEAFSKNKTGQMIIYSTYAILNNLKWEQLYQIKYAPEMAKVLHQIAFINLSKMPAYTTTKDSELWYKYEHWKKITLKQIKQYEPNVLIFGKTLHYFEEDLQEFYSLGKPSKIRGTDLRAFESEERIIIDSCHPGKRFSSEDKSIYVNSLAKRINKWYSEVTEIKQSFESKYTIIAKLAVFLVSNRMKMKSNDIIGFLDTNNFITFRGTSYQSTQGVNNLIRECYRIGDSKTRKLIKKAFVNNQGESIV